ncbi:MAG TPA: prefoldin subunit beta [Candidatus Nanoarchaeia archaeon]|nr:prefoldin subunit beta [Candidatus Nanoarchaeia archaeon]
MSGELPPQVQNQIAQLQQVQQQAQALAQQKNQLEIMVKESDMALYELEKIDNDVPVFKNVGTFLIKADKDKTVEDLKEKKETLDLRLQTIKRQEERIQKRFTQLQEQLKTSVGSPDLHAE